MRTYLISFVLYLAVINAVGCTRFGDGSSTELSLDGHDDGGPPSSSAPSTTDADQVPSASELPRDGGASGDARDAAHSPPTGGDAAAHSPDITCPAGLPCTIHCTTARPCTIIRCAPGQDCLVTCDGTDACRGLSVQATNAETLTVRCPRGACFGISCSAPLPRTVSAKRCTIDCAPDTCNQETYACGNTKIDGTSDQCRRTGDGT